MLRRAFAVVHVDVLDREVLALPIHGCGGNVRRAVGEFCKPGLDRYHVGRTAQIRGNLDGDERFRRAIEGKGDGVARFDVAVNDDSIKSRCACGSQGDLALRVERFEPAWLRLRVTGGQSSDLFPVIDVILCNPVSNPEFAAIRRRR